MKQGYRSTARSLGAQFKRTADFSAAVERSDSGALRFDLAGQESGAWLEGHPKGSRPDSFTGGLQDPQSLVRSTPLGPHWFLTRYN